VIAPVTVFIALLPISLGGFGPREVTFVTLMATLGVPAESALALVLLREACNLATALPGAILYVTSRGFASAEGMEAVGEEVPPP
ncbi:MAG TPA: hypothetical protein ENK19_00490, partial [Acidobacteria bacterium]|nr:hypothetical protein [Acidobacteriota bacterium]